MHPFTIYLELNTIDVCQPKTITPTKGCTTGEIMAKQWFHMATHCFHLAKQQIHMAKQQLHMAKQWFHMAK